MSSFRDARTGFEVLEASGDLCFSSVGEYLLLRLGDSLEGERAGLDSGASSRLLCLKTSTSFAGSSLLEGVPVHLVAGF